MKANRKGASQETAKDETLGVRRTPRASSDASTSGSATEVAFYDWDGYGAMPNENYEVLETYTFNRFIGIETNHPYAEYMSIHSIFGFILYEYIHIPTTIQGVRTWLDKTNIPTWDDANIQIAEEAFEVGNVKNYKIYENKACVGIRNYFKKETATLATSVRNRCPKTILKVNYKNYEYKHVLYPNKVIYIGGE